MADVVDKELWEECKKIVMRKHKRWNARAAQQAVQLYKRRGGKYKGKKKKNNSLDKWTDEEWQYVNGNKNGRYLPKAIIDQLTAEQRRITNRNKFRGTRQGIKNVPWEDFILKLWDKLDKLYKSRNKK